MKKGKMSEFPPFSPADLSRKENVLLAAKLMLNAAYTAPVAGAVPQLESHFVDDLENLEEIALKIEELAPQNTPWEKRFKYEAVMLRETDVLILLGNYRAGSTPFDASCGLCGGEDNCGFFYRQKRTKYGLVDSSGKPKNDMLVDGPLCTARVGDLGFAVGSALWMATRLLVDARPFFTMGIAAKKLGYCHRSSIVVGIPVAAISKNPYVDIHQDYHLINRLSVMDSAWMRYVTPRIIATYDYRKWEPDEDSKKNEEK